MTPTDSTSPSARMVMVFGTGSIPEGLLVKGLLESEGIPVQMKGEAEGPYRMGPVSIWVPEAFEVQARLVLEEATSSPRDGESASASSTEEPSGPSSGRTSDAPSPEDRG
jgi:hypothetical protein